MARRNSPGWRSVALALVAADTAALAAGLSVAYFGRILVSPEGDLLRQPAPVRFGVIVLIGLFWLAVLWKQGLYRRPNLFSGFDEYRRVITGSAFATLIIVVASYFWRGPVLSRGFTTLSLLAVAIFLCTGRFFTRRVIHSRAAHGRPLFRALVIGANRDGVSIARQLAYSRSATTEVVGFLSEYHPVGSEPLPGIPVLAEPLQLLEVASRTGAGLAIVVESGLSWESLHWVVRMMHRADGPEVVLVPSLYDLHATAMSPQQLGPVLALAPRPARIIGFDAMMKRSLDLVVGITALVAGLPLIAAQLVGSLASGHGSGLEREQYVDGRGAFHLWRFSRPSWAVRLHMSRLPSLLAVLSGRISLLGPRPIPWARQAEYADAKPLLESAKAGFIGPWWLVDRKRPDTFAEELAYDLHYLRNYTIWFDLQILFHVLRGAGVEPQSPNGPRGEASSAATVATAAADSVPASEAPA